MKKTTLLAALLATTTVAGFAFAQLQFKPPAVKLPPNIKKAPPNTSVKLSNLAVQAKCGQASTVSVSVQYSGFLLPNTVTIWGTIGQKDVEIPTGSGTKTFDFPGPVLTCAGQNQNWAQVLFHSVYIDQKGIFTNGFGTTSFGNTEFN